MVEALQYVFLIYVALVILLSISIVGLFDNSVNCFTFGGKFFG